MPTRRAFLQGLGGGAVAGSRLLAAPAWQPPVSKAFSSRTVPAYKGVHPDVYDYIDRHFDDHLARIQEFLRQPSVSAQSIGIKETASMVVEMLREIGATDAALVPTDGHPGVWGSIDAGARRTLLNYGMYDVQPVNPDEWSSPPWEARIVPLPPFKQAIVGRGTVNTKGALRAFVNACDAIIKVRGRLPVNLQFAIEGEEEIGSPHYNQIVDAHETEMRRADAVLFAMTEQGPHGDISMNLGVKGIAYIEVEADGSRSGIGPAKGDIHSSLKAVVDSPVWRLVQGLATLTDRSGNTIAIPGYAQAVRPPSDEEWELINGLIADFDEEELRKEYGVSSWIGGKAKREMILSYLYDATINIAGIYGGYGGPGPKTILPAKATAKMDLRLPPDMTPDRAVEMLKAHLASNGFADLDVRVLMGYPPSQTSVRTPIVQSAIGVYRKWGVEPEVWPRMAGSAPFYVFTERLAKPFVIFGLGHGAGAHSKDEYLVVDGGGLVANLRTTEKSWVDLLFALADA